MPSATGDDARGGRLSASLLPYLRSVVSTVVIADYALLADPLLRDLAETTPISALAPVRADLPAAGPEEILLRWAGGSGAHITLGFADLTGIATLLDERRRAQERTDSARDDAHRIVSTVAGDYGKLLLHDGVLDPVVVPVVQIQWNVVDDFDRSGRGTGGFGSTGR